MRMIRDACVLTLALVAAACGQEQTTAPENQAAASSGPEASGPSQVYSGTGTVKSITGNQVAIAHGPIAGIGWPAMTMTFTAPSNAASGIRAGDKVSFSFQQEGTAFVLTSVKPK